MKEPAKSEREWVKICMAELCSKAGLPDCSNLVQRDLEFISESIEAKTGVLISLSTIKRLFNGQFSRQPQVATLNAIAIFLGYQHWQDFKKAKLRQEGTRISNDGRLPGQTKKIFLSKKIFQARFIVIAGLLLFIAITLFAFLRSKSTGVGNFEQAKFSMNRTTRSDLPNSVVFNYDVEMVSADSFFIQQSWDKDRRVRIDPKKNTLSDIYYEPGYHIAKLIANEKVIKTIDVSIPTDRWFYYAKQRKPASVPQYIHGVNGDNGSMSMTKEDLLRSGIDIEKEHIYFQVYFPGTIQYSSGNYVLKCKAKVNDVRNNFCPFLMCEVFCQKNFMFFKSTTKGCTSDAKAQFGDNVLDGKTNDLSLLGTTVNGWHYFEIVVRDQQVSVRIDNVEVLSAQYKEPSGLITGLGFLSNGLPEIDFVSLATLDGKDIYRNELEK